MKILFSLLGLFLVTGAFAQDYSAAQARYEKAQDYYSSKASQLKSRSFSPDIFAFANFEVHEVTGTAYELGEKLVRVDLTAYEAGAGITGGKYFYLQDGKLVAVQLYFMERQDGARVEAPYQVFFYENGQFTGAVNTRGLPVASDQVQRQNSENLSDWSAILEAL